MQTIRCPKCGKQLTIGSDDGDMIFCEYCGAKVHININVNYNYNYSKSEHTEHIVDDAKIKAADNVNRVIGIFATPFEEYRAQKDHVRHMEEEQQRAYEDYIRTAQEQTYRNAEKRAERAQARQDEHSRQWKALRKKAFKVCRAHPKESLISLAVCAVLLFSGVTAWSHYAAKKQETLQHAAELARLEREQIGYSHLAQGEVQMPEIEIGTYTDYRIVKQDLERAGFTNITTEPVGDLTSTGSGLYNVVVEVTVDGVPRMEVGSWYKIDVPVVISYHDVSDEALTPAEQAYSIAQGLLHGKSDE